MFAYILRAPDVPQNEQTEEFFRRFLEEPGLLHAFDLYGVDNPSENLVVAIWESREAAERYLDQAALRREIDESIPKVTRTKYEVRAGR